MSRPNSSPHRGFTLIELLVVVAIIGVLVGLLISAITYINEAARMTQCANNARQISLGFFHFHEAYGHFPRNENGWGPYGHLVPFLEVQPSLPVDVRGPIPDPLAMGTDDALVQFQCPNERNNFPPTVLSHVMGLELPVTATSYAVSGGPNYSYSGNPQEPHVVEGGSMPLNTGMIATLGVPDGDSNTLLLGEIPQRPLWYARWTTATTQCEPALEPTNPLGLGSQHQGRFHVVLLDGHLSVLRFNIHVDVLRALSTVNGGEIVDQESVSPLAL